MAASDFADEPHDADEARIEIVPLIDIMFFLLAAFILISLGAVRLKLHSVKLPTAVAAATATAATPPLSLAINAAGEFAFEGAPVAPAELVEKLAARKTAAPELRLVVAADKEARHADVMRALDAVRRAGVDNIGFAVSAPAP
jgi:biopolymer transport protein ExbD